MFALAAKYHIYLDLITLFVLVLHVLRTVFGFILLNKFIVWVIRLFVSFLYYCMCSVTYFIVHAAFVRIKLMMINSQSSCIVNSATTRARKEPKVSRPGWCASTVRVPTGAFAPRSLPKAGLGVGCRSASPPHAMRVGALPREIFWKTQMLNPAFW